MREINHLSVHQWLRSAIRDSQQQTSPIGFLFLKLPPPPCAVLLVYIYIYIFVSTNEGPFMVQLADEDLSTSDVVCQTGEQEPMTH